MSFLSPFDEDETVLDCKEILDIKEAITLDQFLTEGCEIDPTWENRQRFDKLIESYYTFTNSSNQCCLLCDVYPSFLLENDEKLISFLTENKTVTLLKKEIYNIKSESPLIFQILYRNESSRFMPFNVRRVKAILYVFQNCLLKKRKSDKQNQENKQFLLKPLESHEKH